MAWTNGKCIVHKGTYLSEKPRAPAGGRARGRVFVNAHNHTYLRYLRYLPYPTYPTRPTYLASHSTLPYLTHHAQWSGHKPSLLLFSPCPLPFLLAYTFNPFNSSPLTHFRTVSKVSSILPYHCNPFSSLLFPPPKPSLQIAMCCGCRVKDLRLDLQLAMVCATRHTTSSARVSAMVHSDH